MGEFLPVAVGIKLCDCGRSAPDNVSKPCTGILIGCDQFPSAPMVKPSPVAVKTGPPDCGRSIPDNVSIPCMGTPIESGLWLSTPLAGSLHMVVMTVYTVSSALSSDVS